MQTEVPVSRRGEIMVLALLVLAAFGIRFYFLQFYDVISADGISYVAIAKDFITGKGLAAATHYPPFYPILLGLASLVTPHFEAAGLTVSVLMGSLLAVPVYLLGREFFDRKAGVVAAVLAITWPTLRYWSTAVMSQATYITLLLMGVYCLWRGFRNSALLPSILAGIFFGCAHLTRSEGGLVLFAQIAVLVAFTLVQRLEPRKLLYLLLTLGVFFLVFSPYAVMLHELTGKWQLTGKSKVTIADALSEYLRKPDLKHDPTFREIGYLDLFRQYPDYVSTNYRKNLARCWNEMLPWYGWMLAAIGVSLGAWRRERMAERAYLLASFVPLGVIIVFFFIGPEYTQAYLPVLFLFMGNALSRGAAWVLAAAGEGTKGVAALYLPFLPIVLACLYGGWNVVREVPADRNLPYDCRRDGGRYDDKRIGLKLGKVLPENAVLMTRSGRIGFYSGRSYVTPPQSDFAGIVEFARKNKANYLIATLQLLQMRPQLEFLYTPIIDPGRPFTPPPDLELVGMDQEPGGLPYLVYRFK